ncbi:DUF1672 domain-containing protein [Macrococcoides canis]|uniref:DUF1672 family protein n=1 Tax=Macrococcoides canis TaxID=1855823 RepID=A0A1W7A994_9STAP|nr:hypothetical protein [Macrococcus canis]ARQ06205.1 hypothetical protein MCCS_05540 [Macrococcus canis]
MNKLFKLTIVAVTLTLLSACSEESENQSASNVVSKSSEEKTNNNQHSTRKDSTKTNSLTKEKKSTESSTEQKDTEKDVENTYLKGYSFVTTQGDIDFSSPDFFEYYFKNDHRNEVFGIKKGMTRSEVENILGHSNTIKELGLQGSMKTTMYGEIGINYFEDKVAEIRLVPDEEITAEMMKQYYGEPTFDPYIARENPDKYTPLDYQYNMYEYNSYQNGFMIFVYFAKENSIQQIYQYDDENATHIGDKSTLNIGIEEVGTLPKVSYTDEDTETEQQKLLDAATTAIDQIDQGINAEENKTLAWNALIRGPVPGYWNKYPHIREKAVEQMERLSVYNPNTKEYIVIYK